MTTKTNVSSKGLQKFAMNALRYASFCERHKDQKGASFWRRDASKWLRRAATKQQQENNHVQLR